MSIICCPETRERLEAAGPKGPSHRPVASMPQLEADFARIYRMRIRFAVVGFACLLVLALWVPAEPGTRKVTLFFSGYVNGAFEPCGCPEGPTGGPARRSGFANSYASAHDDFILNVDAGGYFAPLGPKASEINEFMKRTIREIPLQVVNLIDSDSHLWADIAADERLRDRFVSTNLEPKSAGIPAPRRYAVIDVPEAGVRLGFVGLTDPRRVRPNSPFHALDPGEAIEGIKGEILRSADFLIVLADLDRETVEEIARNHSEVYAVLRVERRFRIDPPHQVGNAVLLSTVERGRHLGRLTLSLDPEGRVSAYEPEYIEMSADISENPELRVDSRTLGVQASRP